jgi:hypothetical protein
MAPFSKNRAIFQIQILRVQKNCAINLGKLFYFFPRFLLHLPGFFRLLLIIRILPSIKNINEKKKNLIKTAKNREKTVKKFSPIHKKRTTKKLQLSMY